MGNPSKLAFVKDGGYSNVGYLCDGPDEVYEMSQEWRASKKDGSKDPQPLSSWEDAHQALTDCIEQCEEDAGKALNFQAESNGVSRATAGKTEYIIESRVTLLGDPKQRGIWEVIDDTLVDFEEATQLACEDYAKAS